MRFAVNKRYARKAALVFGLTAVLHVSALPWLDNFAPGPAALEPVLEVLKENKAGLGAVDTERLAEVILVESNRYKLDPLFVLALIKTESNFSSLSKSLSGALGLMQILPFTGRALAEELNLKWRGPETLLDPYTNVRMGIHYISSLTDRFNDINASLAAYNAGPTYLAARMRSGELVAQNYVNRVMDNYKVFKERAEYY